MKFTYTPRVLQCMRFKKEDTVGSATRTVMDYELDLCVDCNREMWIDDIRYQLKKGCFILRKPGQTVRSKGYYDCYMLTLDFSNRAFSSSYSRNTATNKQVVFENEIWDILPSVFTPSHYDDYVRIFKHLISINDIDINENKNTLPLINELLHLLLADVFSGGYAKVQESSVIDDLCSYMKKNYMKKIDLDELAEIAHLNKSYLVRQFKKNFGVSPISYLINIRMEYAKKF